MDRLQSTDGRGWLTVWTILVMLLLLAAVGWVFAMRSAATHRHARLVESEAELKRLAYVMKRDEELRQRRAEVRERLSELGIELEPLSERPVHGTWPAVGPPPASLPVLPGRVYLAEQSAHLDSQALAIAVGRKAERRLPELEREIAGLQARLARVEGRAQP